MAQISPPRPAPVGARLPARLLSRAALRRRLADGLAYAALIALSGLSLLPLLWMLSIALRDLPSVAASPPRLLPSPPRWGNFAEAMAIFPFWRYAANTLGIAALRILGTLTTGSLVAFAFARYRVPGKGLVFMLVISPLFLPEQVTLIPLFALFASLGWINTYYPLIVPAFFGGAPLFIFLLRQFFMTIPTDLDDAARLDGCSELGIFWRIIMPLSAPALATVAVFEFMHTWNDFLLPLIVINSADMYTVSLGLARFLGGQQGETPWHLLMAAAVLVTIPPLALFFAAQRYVVQGVVSSGLKG